MRPKSASCLAALGLVWATGSAAAIAQDAPLFDVPLAACSYGGAAVADLDGDGRPEILFGTYYHDERVLALRGDGSILWQIPSGGGPVDGSVTAADLDGDGRIEVMWGNAETTEFHVADASGHDRWTRTIGEVLDAPAAIGDVNGDGRLDIVLASCGASTGRGGLRAFTGSTGELLWTAERGGCYQSAPLLFDQDGDGLLDVVVSTWFNERVRGFSGQDGHLRWETPIGGWTYHAGSFGDLNGDGVPDVALGDYSATLWAIDGASGRLLWSSPLAGERYVFGPTAMGDLDGDGEIEIVVAADRLYAFRADGRPMWAVELPGYALRGPVLTDADGDALPDIVVACDGPALQVRSGRDGALLFDRRMAPSAGMDFHPAVADLDGDGGHEVFVVFGRGQSDTPEANWGRAVAWSIGGGDAGWPTYSHDHHHSGNYGYPGGGAVNRVTVTATPTATATFTPAATATSTATATATFVATSAPSALASSSRPARRLFLPRCAR